MFPEERADLRAAMIVAKVHNASGNYQKAVSIEEVMPKFGQASNNEDGLLGQFRAYAMMYQG